MSSPSKIYVITGANRQNGIGFGLVAHILATEADAFVYAGARDPKKAPALEGLQEKYPGRLAIVQCISGDVPGNAAMAKEIEEKHGRVDTVIANAGMSGTVAKVHEVSSSDMEEIFQTNVMGPLVLFQATYELLKKSANPRFISMSSIGGSLSANVVRTQIGAVCYGSTKAMLNWITRKIHFENEWLVAFPMHPGGVATDMLHEYSERETTGVFKSFLTGKEPTSAEAASSILKLINEATREKEGGEFLNFDGTKIPW